MVCRTNGGKLLSKLKAVFRKELIDVQSDVGLFVLANILVTCTHRSGDLRECDSQRSGDLRECEKNSLCDFVFLVTLCVNWFFFFLKIFFHTKPQRAQRNTKGKLRFPKHKSSSEVLRIF